MNWGAGTSAPEILLRRENGETVQLPALLREGPVVLAFFKTTCPTCQLALPFLNRLSGAPVAVYCVSQDDPHRTKAFCAEYGVETAMLYDRADDGYPASNAFGITHVPSIYLLEGVGGVVWSSVGFYRSDFEDLGRRFDRVMFTPADHVPAMKGG